MTEKKSLDFDFLDKDTKNTHSEPSSTEQIKPAVKIAPREGEKLGFVEFFKQCYSNFSKFCEEHLTKKNPQYLLLVIWVVGMGAAADRLTSTIKDSDGWGDVWAIVIFGGILAAAIAYYVQGWFYDVRIKWSKGTTDSETARHIWLFSTLPISAVSVLSLIFNQMAYGSDYFNAYYSETTTVDTIFIILSLVAIVYSICISYKAVRKVAKAEKGRAIWWFIVAPVIFYVLIAIAGASSS